MHLRVCHGAGKGQHYGPAVTTLSCARDICTYLVHLQAHWPSRMRCYTGKAPLSPTMSMQHFHVCHPEHLSHHKLLNEAVTLLFEALFLEWLSSPAVMFWCCIACHLYVARDAVRQLTSLGQWGTVTKVATVTLVGLELLVCTLQVA